MLCVGSGLSSLNQLPRRDWLQIFVLGVNCTVNFDSISAIKPVPVSARSKAYVYGRSPAEIVGSNPTGGMDVCLL